MRKNTLLVSALVVLTLAVCVNAYAEGNTCAVSNAASGFWNSLTGFLYNALPWNWGNWAGK